MSNIAYLSKRNDEGIMTSLGLEHVFVDKDTSVDGLIRELKYRGMIILYVSETVYEENAAAIDYYNKDLSISIHVLANHAEHERVGSKRIRTITEDAIGFYNEKEGI